MKVSQHFTIQEFVPPEVFAAFGDKSIQFVDPKIIMVVDLLRRKLGKPVTVNNWYSGGQYKESGFRMPTTATGASLSQHKFGRAADVKVEGMTSKEVYEFILLNKWELIGAGLTTLENIAATKTWVHMDVRPSFFKEIQIVNP